MSDAARKAALDAVLAVWTDDAYANLVMPAILDRARLRGRDAAFATELAFGTLRMAGLYDAVVERATGRSPAALDDAVRAVLLLGCHQWIGLGTAAHAVVSESVDLARAAGAGRASGLVNAAMRRVTEATPGAWRDRVAPGHTTSDRSVRYSHPTWVVEQLEASLRHRGRGEALDALMEAHNTPAAVTLAARVGLVDRDELVAETGGEATSLSPWGVRLAGGSPGVVESVRQGRAGVQDEGSQIVAGVLATVAAREATAGERWLDACAGPGGKTALLGSLAVARGATVDAVELHPHRAGLVKGAIQALPPGVVSVHVGDATTWEEGPYDRILVDAPCTGLGALRRRPEARWRRSPADLDDLVALQGRILAQAATLLAPGGVIAYVTCSPLLAETIDIVRASGLAPKDARLAMAELTGTSVERWGSGPDVQLWTDRDGTDSMFVALLTAPPPR